MANVWDQILADESANLGHTAKNPQSSASGLFQMIKPTALSLAEKYRPDLIAQYGGKDGFWSAFQNSPSLQETFKDFGDKDNRAIAERKGVPYDPGLFHRLGAGDAMRVMSADPTTPLDSILSSKIMKINPDLRGRTAADIIATGGYPRRAGGRSGPPPASASVGPGQQEASAPRNPMQIASNDPNFMPNMGLAPTVTADTGPNMALQRAQAQLRPPSDAPAIPMGPGGPATDGGPLRGPTPAQPPMV